MWRVRCQRESFQRVEKGRGYQLFNTSNVNITFRCQCLGTLARFIILYLPSTIIQTNKDNSISIQRSECSAAMKHVVRGVTLAPNSFQSVATALSTYTYNPSAEQKKFRPIVWGLLKGILCRLSLSEVEVDEAGKGKEGTL